MEFKKSKCMICKTEQIVICVYNKYELCSKCYANVVIHNKFSLP